VCRSGEDTESIAPCIFPIGGSAVSVHRSGYRRFLLRTRTHT
jgi:hypothetical protein